MGIAIVIIGFGLIAYGIYKFIKGISLLWKVKNPYIYAHRFERDKQKAYNEYLEYLKKSNEPPIFERDDLISEQQKEQDDKIRKLFP